MRLYLCSVVGDKDSDTDDMSNNTSNTRARIEYNYINGNIDDAKKLVKKLRINDRKEYAKDAVGIVYYSSELSAEMRKKHLEFAVFLIENI